MIRDDIRPDIAVDIKLLHHMLDTLQERLDSATSLKERKIIADMGLLVSGGFSAGLRGNELLNFRLKGFPEHD